MLFHYTSLDALPAISQSGHLRRSRRDDAYGGVVWFSSNEVWEPVAGKIAQCGSRFMTFEELKREGQFRFARFRLDTLLPTIAPFLPHAPSSWGPEVEALRRTVEEEKARAGINPRDWYRCPHDVDLKHLSLEVWDGGKWKPSPLSATVLLVENECRTGV